MGTSWLPSIVGPVVVRRGPGGPVVMVVPTRIGIILPGSDKRRFTLSPGVVRLGVVRGSGSAVPARGFADVRVSGGLLTISAQPLSARDNVIVIPGDATCTLKLAPEPRPADPPSVPVSEDAHAVVCELPAALTIVAGDGGMTCQASDPVRLRVYGTDVDLSFRAESATVNRSFTRLSFPLLAADPEFAVGTVHSDTFRPAGRAGIASAAWSLPIVREDAAAPDSAPQPTLNLNLGSGLTASLSTLNGPPAQLRDSRLTVRPGEIHLTAQRARFVNARQNLYVRDEQGTCGRLELDHGSVAPLTYRAHAGWGEDVRTELRSCSVFLNQPLTVAGTCLPLRGAGWAYRLVRKESGTHGVVAGALLPAEARETGFALANAVLIAGPATEFSIGGVVEGDSFVSGTATIKTALLGLHPTLPDPYAGNAPGPGLREPAGLLGILVSWAPDRRLTLDFELPVGAWRHLVGTAREPAGSSWEAESPSLPDGVARPDIPHPGETSAVDEERLASLSGLVTEWAHGVGNLVLLDVSGNADQFGVQYGGRQSALLAEPPAVRDMHLIVPGGSLRLVTTPQVSWEAVVTRDLVPSAAGPVYFPSPLTFPGTGGPTVVAVRGDDGLVVQAGPGPAVDAFAGVLAAEGSGAVRLTLPYGIVAAVRIAAESDRPRVELLSPVFPAARARGARQLSITARGPAQTGGTPGLPGAAIILRNARGPFAPDGGLSVLSDVVTPDAGPDATFNDNFSPGRPRAQVPVTRVDLSGYGESLFSDWRNPEDAAAVVSQVRFDVVVGRTAFEVVQIRSILYPYGARVVRTITIERENGGPTVRHDSGWQHVAGGRFGFPVPTTVEPSPVTHPGVVRGVSDIVNIRQLGQSVTLSDGTLLAGVMFDCRADIEGMITGDGVSRGQVGYVQMTDPGNHGQLTVARYAELLERTGPLGGPVDCVVDIGGSGLTMRVTRVAVDRTAGGGPQQFAAAAWGAPSLPPGGSWSMLRQPTGEDSPRPVGRDLGVPLVRRGPMHLPAENNTEPYLFADPADVLTPGAPAAEYGILFATPAHRILFRRPKIDKADTALTSSQDAVLADNFARAAGAGLFPARPHWTLLIPSTWRLSGLPGGQLRLDLPAGPPVKVTNPVRALTTSPAFSSRVEYRDSDGTASNFALTLDTSAATRWTFRIDRQSLVNETAGLGAFVTLVSGVSAADAAPYRMPDAKIVLGGCFAPVQDALDLLAMLGLPSPMDVSVSNSHQLELEAKLSMPIGAPPDFEIDLVAMKIKDASIGVGFGFSWDVSAGSGPDVTGFMEAGAMALVKTAYPPLVAVGLLNLKLAFAQHDVPAEPTLVVVMRAGVGVGAEVKLIGGLELTAYFASFFEIVAGENTFGVLVGVVIKGSIDFGVIEAGLVVEAKMGLIRRECPPVTSLWGLAQFSIAVEISVFAVIDISFSWEMESTSLLYGEESCAIPETA